MLEHFKGEEVFVKKVLEYKEQAVFKQRIICTKFLDPYHRFIIESIIGQDSSLQVLCFGGIENSESQKVIIAPTFYEIEPSDFCITLIKIGYATHFDTLKHSDVLGALMSLGMKRELFGDIVEMEDSFYVAIDSHVFPYVKEQLTSIKRSKVHVKQFEGNVWQRQEYTKKTFIVSSLRLDKVVATFFKVSRAQAVKYIQAGFVKVNHKIVVEISYLCNNNDIISCRRHGRVKFEDTSRKTKSDNYVVMGYFYK